MPLTPHETYLRLGRASNARAAAYRALFQQDLSPSLLEQIRAATSGNFCLGNQRFADEIAATLGRRVTPGASGRPRQRELTE